MGYSRDQYEKTKSLPEGSYRLIFTAYDYRRQEVQVSNQGSSFYYLAKSEPPQLNYPGCNTALPAKEPQQIYFSWLPGNTSSLNSAAQTQYELSLYEIRPQGRDINDVVASTQPIYKTTTSLSQLYYGPADPALIAGMEYAWRVRAVDASGRDLFRNQGFSPVCSFTYGGVDPAFEVGLVKDFAAQGETERRAKISWSPEGFESFRLYYKKSNEGYEWFSADLKQGEYKLFDLEPDTEYQTRIQGKKGGYFGPFSEISRFRTLPQRVFQCGALWCRSSSFTCLISTVYGM